VAASVAKFTLQRFEATPLVKSVIFFRVLCARVSHAKGYGQIRFGRLRNALRNVKGILHYTVWGVLLEIVYERGEGNWQF